MRNRIGRAFAVCAAGWLALAPAVASAQAEIGQATKVVRDVSGRLGPTTRVIAVQNGVFANEQIQTAAASATELLFEDGTRLSVGPGSDVVLDRFVYDTTGNTGALALSMARGTLRFASGQMRPSAYSLRTPTATIGVRGTVFTVVVAADGATTVTVVEGVVTVSSLAGAALGVAAGQSSTVAPAVGGVAPPPSPPGAPPAQATAAVNNMDATLARAPGEAGGTQAAGTGLTTPVLGAAALGAAILLGIVVLGGDDDDDDGAVGTSPVGTAD
jgi:hypothetical protein